MSRFSVLIVLIAFLFSSCASYKYSNKQEGEIIQMEVINEEGLINPRNLDRQEIPGTSTRGLMVGDAISLAAKGIKYLIEEDKKKYTQDYTYGVSDMYFYDRISDESAFDINGMQFNGFDLTRVAEVEPGVTDTTLFISFRVDKENPYEIFNNSAFRMKLTEFKMDYGKAKIPDKRWYLPWTLFMKKQNTINLDVKVTFTATWTGTNSSINRDVEIGTFLLNLRDIPLGDKEAFMAYRDEVVGTSLYGNSLIVPRSFGTYLNKRKEFEKAYGQGLYDILVEVTESGKDDFVVKVVQDNSDVILDEVKSNMLKRF